MGVFKFILCYDRKETRGENKMTTANGMAVLLVRFLFVMMSYMILEKIDWRKLFSKRNYVYAQYVCILASIALGHLTGSFVITIMELLRSILYSIFL